MAAFFDTQGHRTDKSRDAINKKKKVVTNLI